jgi:hypothetical protein
LPTATVAPDARLQTPAARRLSIKMLVDFAVSHVLSGRQMCRVLGPRMAQNARPVLGGMIALDARPVIGAE